VKTSALRVWPLLLLVVGCRPLTLPAADAPGSVSATLLAPRAGRAELAPAVGATLELVGTDSSAVADEDGNVRLEGVTRSSGQLRASYRSPDTGETFERVFDLRLAGVRPGRHTSLGTVALGRRATLLGHVLRGDVSGNSGHSGIRVFVPESPLQAFTADDGFFVLQGVPAGDLTLSAFAPGYAAATGQLEVRPGEERRLDPLTLAVSTATASGALRGSVADEGGHPLAQALVSLDGVAQKATAQSAADGHFEFTGLAPDVVSLRISAPGFRSQRLDNLYLDGTARELPPSVLSAGVDTDDGGVTTGDGGVVVIPGQAVELVSINGGTLGRLSGDDAGSVQIPVPSSVRPGDLMVLFVDRFTASVPETAMRPTEWTFFGSQDFDGDCAEVATRRAGTDEASAVAAYTLHIPSTAQDLAWALVVYRNVASADLVHISTDDARLQGLLALQFSAQPVARGDRILSVATFAQTTGGTCPAPVSSDGGVLPDAASFRSLGFYQVLDVPAASGGALPGFSSACDPGTGVTLYANTQVRLHAP